MKTTIAVSGTALAIALASLTTLSTARADVYAWESTAGDYFGKIDLTTGVFTSNGNTGFLLSGLGAYGGIVYGGAEGGDGLYKINPATGAATLIGDSSEAYEDTGSTTAGVYELGRDSNLYSVNTTNGATTLIGDTGIGISGTIGMSSSGSKLFISHDESLYSIDTSDGDATFVGTTTGAVFGAMAYVGGAYYGGNDSGAYQVDAFNTSTAAITFGPNESTTAYGDFWGLTPVASGVPETSTWAMMLTGFAGLGFIAYRRASHKTGAARSIA